MLRFNSFYILPLKNVKLAFRDLNRVFISLVASGSYCGSVMYPNVLALRERKSWKKGWGEGRGRETMVGPREKRSPEWCGFLRFTTFLIVWNSLSTANKGRKTSLPRLSFHLDRFRERCATARSVASEQPEVTGSWAFQRQQLPFTFPLFNYTVARPRYGVRNAGAGVFTLPKLLPHPPYFCGPSLLRRLHVSRLYPPFVTYLARRRAGQVNDSSSLSLVDSPLEMTSVTTTSRIAWILHAR